MARTINAGPVRLGLLAGSPMHYQAPLYRRLARDSRIDFTVIFASTSGVRQEDVGYGTPTNWDVDLLGGYRSIFLSRADRNRVYGGFFGFRDLDVVKTILEGHYDVLWIHGYNHLTHQFAAVTQILRRKGLILREEQTTLHPRPLWKTAIKKIWFNTVFRRGFALHIGSENRKWFESLGIPPERMFFAPYCVDNNLLRAEAEQLVRSRDQLRLSFGLPVDQPVVLMVGRLIPKKQPALLLEAFHSVRKGLQCSLLIVGSGESESELRTIIEREAIPDVKLLGFVNQSQIARAYAAADVFVLPSKEHETWGIVVNEAMNFGLPVVVTDKVGAGTDLVAPNVNGFVVSGDRPGELTERLKELVSSRELRKRFGEASRQLVEGWNYDVAARGVLAAVAAAVGQDRWGSIAATEIVA